MNATGQHEPVARYCLGSIFFPKSARGVVVAVLEDYGFRPRVVEVVLYNTCTCCIVNAKNPFVVINGKTMADILYDNGLMMPEYGKDPW